MSSLTRLLRQSQLNSNSSSEEVEVVRNPRSVYIRLNVAMMRNAECVFNFRFTYEQMNTITREVGLEDFCRFTGNLVLLS